MRYFVLGAVAVVAVAIVYGVPRLTKSGKFAGKTLSGVDCEVLATTTGERTDYVGRVRPDEAARGSYSMRVERQSGGLTSSTNTVGTFDAATGEVVELGRSTLHGDLTGIEVTMTVTVADATRTCPVTAESAL